MTDANVFPAEILARHRKARDKRAEWESIWRECYDYALPSRAGALAPVGGGAAKPERLFDGTAPDAVDQLAASLLSQLTPPWARWFGLAPGSDAAPEARAVLAPELERAAQILQSHFDRSNFAVEMHQCYLDLATAGTASLLIEEAPPGEASALRFSAVPLAQLAFEETGSGRLEAVFRRWEMPLARVRARFPHAEISAFAEARGARDPDATLAVIEAVLPEAEGFLYAAVADPEQGPADEAALLGQGRFAHSPFVSFRWLKAPGELYGRSPVMKALPDIKTANKVVELVLKNASIAVTGIWQADDDGVLNPATVRLVPGAIIPKAVGSAGLTPLEAPGRFDVSQLVLEELRARIRQALLADKLGQVSGPRMSATEVLERAAEMARVLGATYGRLQSELLTPLLLRAIAILARRGEIPPLAVDGRAVTLEYKSPLARNQARMDAQQTLLWLGAVRDLGPEALAAVDHAEAARWLGRAFGVPGELIREPSLAPGDAGTAIAALAEALNPGSVS
ncbi:MAG: phage tail protein [Rhodospirillales bacterium RIFCSPLOWO2_12_FULL_67_15]|nr:MAG: phage tail protein [Rhodospirillales bacterium RIFCSPLOWO2_12_FULL_67_15]